MRWTVEGADKETGQERVIAIDADNKAEAERIASKRGLLVSDVHQPVNLTDAEKLDAMIAPSVESPQSVAASATPSPQPQPVSYRWPAQFHPGVPDYAGLKIGGSILIIFAVLYYIFAAIAVFITVVGAMQNSSSFRVPGMFVQISTGCVAAITCGMIGGLLHAASAACGALRDIARNSFAR